MKLEDRIACYRGWVMTLAGDRYNGGDEGDKQAVAALLHMGDRRLDYTFEGEPPEKLTDGDVASAMDAIFERAGI